MKYRKKEVVDAIKWTGLNNDMIKELIGDDYYIINIQNEGLHYLELRRRTVFDLPLYKIFRGDYVVKDKGGLITVYDEQNFEAKFEEIDDED